MSEIAVQSNTEITMPAPSALALWAQDAREAAQIATSLARTSFVPASLRGKPEDITAAILAGQELGLPPMAILRSMDVIQGTPALRAHAMRGLVQSHGHSVQLVESTPQRCVMRGRRQGEQEWQTVTWDLQRASQMGLLQKSEWKKQPQTMLVARATGEICRLIAADALFAMPYNSEELQSMASQLAETGADDGRIRMADLTDPAPVQAELTAAPAEEASPAVADDGWTVTTPGPENEWPEQDGWPQVAQPGSAE